MSQKRKRERRAKRQAKLSEEKLARRAKIKEALVSIAEKVADVVTTAIPGDKDDIAVEKLKSVVKKKVAKKKRL